MEWVDGNLGSKVTMKYPAVYLMEEGAHGEILSIAFAGPDQHQDAGGKVVHVAPHTTSRIISKSIPRAGRALIAVCSRSTTAPPFAHVSATRCCSTTATAPTPTVHEIDESKSPSAMRRRSARSARNSLHLMSRGIDEQMAGYADRQRRGRSSRAADEYAIEMNADPAADEDRFNEPHYDHANHPIETTFSREGRAVTIRRAGFGFRLRLGAVRAGAAPHAGRTVRRTGRAIASAKSPSLNGSRRRGCLPISASS